MKRVEEVEKFIEDYKKEILSSAALLKCAKMPRASRELFELFSKTGNRLEYEKVYFARRKYLLVFFMEMIIKRDDRASDSIENINEKKSEIEYLEGLIEEILSEECHALPAHVDLSRAGYEKTLDLFAAETAQMLTEIITLVPDISEIIKKKVIEHVFERVIVPFYNKRQGFEINHSNWSAVCAGSIGVAAIYLRKYMDEKMLKDILERVNKALEYYVKGISEDGICFEGLDYWNYGFSYYVLYESVLKSELGIDIGLLDKDRIQKTMAFQNNCYFTSGKTVSFSDGSSNSYYKMGLAAYLAIRNNQEIPNINKAAGLHTDPCYRFAYGYRDYAWAKEYVKYLKEKDVIEKVCNSRANIYPKGEWAIAESENGIGFAIKGGNNDEPHNHNDIGNFTYFVDDKEVVTDLGAGEYTKDYFSDKRYDILCNSARGHSVPEIMGHAQCAGREYRATFFEGKQDDKLCEVEVGIGGAYPIQCEAVRRAKFDLKTGTLIVEDEIINREAINREAAFGFREHIVTRELPQVVSDNEISLGESGATLCIENLSKTLEVEKHTHMNHAGNPEDIYIISWEVTGSKQNYCLLVK